MNEDKPKTWREKMREYNKRSTGFHFVGWNKQGVPKWEGLWTKGPPLWFCRMFVGLTGIIFSLLIVLPFLLTGKDRNIALAVLAPETILFGVITWLMYRQRQNLQPLKSAEEVSAQLGLDTEGLERLTENNKIKPRYIINDKPMYNPRDFDEKGILLRASEAPVSPETLLRPAIGEASTPQKQLLRPSATERPLSETVGETVAEVRNTRA